LDKRVARGWAFRTVIFLVILAFEYALSHASMIIQNLGFDLSFTFLPLVVASTIIYSVSLADVLVKGELWADVLKGTLAFAVGLFLAMILALFPSPANLTPLSLWLLTAVIIVVGAYVSRAVFESYHDHVMKVLSVSFALFILGYVSSQMIAFFSQQTTTNYPPSFNIVVFCSFAVASVLSLLGLFSGSENLYLSHVGKVLSRPSSLAVVLVVALFLFLYSFDVRPILAASYSIYLLPLEWGAVLVFSFAIYRNTRSYVEKASQDLDLGKWTRLIQKIEQKKGNVEEVSRIVRKFVEEGSKEEVLAYLLAILQENQASPLETVTAIHRIIDYRDVPGSRLTLFSKLENSERENKSRRKEVLRQTLQDTADVLRVHFTPARWLNFQMTEDSA